MFLKVFVFRVIESRDYVLKSCLIEIDDDFIDFNWLIILDTVLLANVHNYTATEISYQVQTAPICRLILPHTLCKINPWPQTTG